MNFDFLYWREPLWLLIILIPLLMILIVKIRQKKIWQTVVDPHLLDWVINKNQLPSQKIMISLLAITWILLCISLAGPRMVKWIPASLKADKMIVISIVDFSRSMTAQEPQITRINKAQNLLKQYILNIPDNLSLGIIIYSGQSYTYLPPTDDKKILAYYSQQLNLIKPPTLGNNLSSAFIEASTWLKKNYKKDQQQIILFSDGDLGSDSQSQAEKTILKLQQQYNFEMTTIGLGGSEAVVVPNSLPNRIDSPLIIKGKTIVSRRQGAWLKNLTKITHGTYYQQEDINSFGLTNLMALLKLVQPRIKSQYNNQVLWDEWFIIPLLSAVIILSLILTIIVQQEKAIPTLKKSLSKNCSNSDIANYTIISILTLLVLASCYTSETKIKTIHHLLAQKKYSQVKELSQSMQGYDALFAQGVACYRLKEFNCAQYAFSRAAWQTSKKDQRARAIFNLANTHFKLGDYEQASVLFKNAQQLGIAKQKTQLNKEFADDLSAAVKHRLLDIKKSLDKADWLAAVQNKSLETTDTHFSNRVSDGIYLSDQQEKQLNYRYLSDQDEQVLIARGIYRLQNSNTERNTSNKNSWFQSSKNKQTMNMADLFNRLMAMEAGIPYFPEQALTIEGQRSW
jgi:tetratricopeptide (TPR) repeat protein